MPKTIHTITLPSGEVETRESATRAYTHAVVVIYTEEYKNEKCKAAQARLDASRAALAALPELTDEDKLTFAALEATHKTLQGKSGNWDAYKAVSDAYYNSVGMKHAQLVDSVERNMHQLATCQAIKVGSGLVAGWSMSASNAAKMVTSQKHYHLCKVYATDQFETRVRAERATKK